MGKTVIVCPFCKYALDQFESEVYCSQCNKHFPFKKGVLCFGEPDDFYEGKFTATKEWGGHGYNDLIILKKIYRRLNISGFEARFLEKNIARYASNSNSDILDFGCGGYKNT
jgi:hypothetical protein